MDKTEITPYDTFRLTNDALKKLVKKSSRKDILTIVGINGEALKHAINFQDDREVVLTAVSQMGGALEHASTKKRK